MKLLLDTNIFLEVLLGQEKAIEARELLSRTNTHDFYISDFSLHSIGLLFFRRKLYNVFHQFLSDMIFETGIGVIGISADEMEIPIKASVNFNLDFDDAYQYSIAEKNGLQIVSFDSNFDRTEKGRKTPEEIQ